MRPRRPGLGAGLAGDQDVVDRLVVTAVVLVGLVVGLVWAGAALASALGGRWPLPAGFADAAGALVRLVANPGRPATAWPEPARAVLPGAPLYWGAQALVLAAGAGLARLGFAVFRPGRERDGLGVERSARFAGRHDLAGLRVGGPTPGRLVLGRVADRLVAAEARSGVCVVGPSQSGKTSGLCVPLMLEAGAGTGAVIASSVKGDLYAVTQYRRASLGQVKVFDPTGSVVVRSATWSPLRAARTATGAQAASRALIEVAGKEGLESSDFWIGSAGDLLWPLMFLAAHAEATMSDVVRWITTHDRPVINLDGVLLHEGEVAQLLRELEEDHAGADRTSDDRTAFLTELQAAGQLLRGIWADDERTRSNVYTTARTVTRAWSDPKVAAASESCEITPEWLLSGDNTLYVVAPARDQARLRPVFACLVADLVHQAFDVATANGGELDTKLLVLLDEAANICPVRELPAWCSTCPSHGITLVTVWQDRSQQHQRYGREGAETLWNNSAAKVVLSGLADKATADVTQMLGDEDHERHGTSTDMAAGRRSQSTQTATRRLLSPDSLRRQPPGQGLLVYKNRPPMRLKLRHWPDDAGLVRLKEVGR